jgi:putative intracellular protease/amidase
MNLPHRLLIAPAIAAALSFVSVPSHASDLASSRIVEPAVHSGGAAHTDLMYFLLQPVEDPAQFEGRRVAIVASDGASAFELETTRDYFSSRGARVDVLAPRPAGSATIVGLAGFVPPREALAALDYAGPRRAVAVTWYLDQVRPQSYDAVYVPNHLEGIEQLGANAQAMRFLIAVRAAQRPIFVTGNANAIVPGWVAADTFHATSIASTKPVALTQQWQVYAAQGAFDIPQLIGALAAVLTATEEGNVN